MSCAVRLLPVQNESYYVWSVSDPHNDCLFLCKSSHPSLKDLQFWMPKFLLKNQNTTGVEWPVLIVLLKLADFCVKAQVTQISKDKKEKKYHFYTGSEKDYPVQISVFLVKSQVSSVSEPFFLDHVVLMFGGSSHCLNFLTDIQRSVGFVDFRVCFVSSQSEKQDCKPAKYLVLSEEDSKKWRDRFLN